MDPIPSSNHFCVVLDPYKELSLDLIVLSNDVFVIEKQM